MPPTKKDETAPANKTSKPRVSKTVKETVPESPIAEHPKCHVSDDLLPYENFDVIRERVCRHLETTEHTDGNHYCFLHLPVKDKDANQFKQIINQRFDEIAAEVAKIEAEQPETEWEAAKSKLRNDFCYVWFPPDFSFSEKTFTGAADFISATFTGAADFRSATFTGDADFRSAKFLETSQVFFLQTRFCKTVDFTYAVFAGYVAFEGEKDENVFLDRKTVLDVRKELIEKFVVLQKELAGRGIDFQIPDRFEDNQEAVLNLQNARLEKPERISFHRVRLCPGWFVNVDSREMVFTDVRWDKLDAKSDNSNIAAEIKSLEKRAVSEPRRLLEIACRQLGVNAEENNRYEDASKFRYMAMETKRLEYGWKGRLWTLSWWYRLSSGYGENWSQAFFVLLGILVLSGVFYNSPFANFEMAEKKQVNAVVTQEIEKSTEPKPPEYYKMNNLEGFVHSLYVAALQRPEPKAADTTTRLFVILETIFAPLQAGARIGDSAEVYALSVQSSNFSLTETVSEARRLAR